MWIGSLEEIKCENYCEHHCENFIFFDEWSSLKKKSIKSIDKCDKLHCM
jgi:SET domain-containing protein